MSAPKPSFVALGERIAREEDAILARPLRPDEARLREPRPARRERRPRVWAVGAVAATFALAGVGSFVAIRSRPLTLTVKGEAAASGAWVAAPPGEAVPIRFSEGTELTLEPETRARVADVTRRGAHVLLESGAAHVSVTPGRGGEWTFTAGPYQVDVKGTRFDIGWAPGEQVFSLKLVEGSVLVSGCSLGERHPIFPGETLTASCLTHEFQIERGESAKLTAPHDAPPAAAALPTPPSTTAAVELDPSEVATRQTLGAGARVSPPRSSRSGAAGEESWQSLARASKFKEAFARVTERGFDTELGRSSRDELLLLGDVARLSGDPSRALVAYQRVRSRAPGSDAAANAAFAIGRVDFDQRAAYAEAASWFAAYRAERSEGPLARDATGRQMEALSRAGDAAAATRIAEEYLRKYPRGPHAALARSLRPEPN